MCPWILGVNDLKEKNWSCFGTVAWLGYASAVNFNFSHLLCKPIQSSLVISIALQRMKIGSLSVTWQNGSSFAWSAFENETEE
jgi:hypothetical protein